MQTSCSSVSPKVFSAYSSAACRIRSGASALAYRTRIISTSSSGMSFLRIRLSANETYSVRPSSYDRSNTCSALSPRRCAISAGFAQSDSVKLNARSSNWNPRNPVSRSK